MRRRPGPLAFSLRTFHQRRVARSSDRLGVQGHPGTFPHAGSGEVAFAIANRGGSVRVWCLSGRKVAIKQLLPEGYGPEQLALNAPPTCVRSRCWRLGCRSIRVPNSLWTSHCGPLSSASQACPNAATIDGAVLVKARADKERKYAELVNGDRCRLVVVGVETGGRWSDEAVTFLDHLASARAREPPPILRGSAFFMWRRCWSRMLAVACGGAFAQSLVSAAERSCGVEGPTHDLADLCGGV